MTYLTIKNDYVRRAYILAFFPIGYSLFAVCGLIPLVIGIFNGSFWDEFNDYCDGLSDFSVFEYWNKPYDLPA